MGAWGYGWNESDSALDLRDDLVSDQLLAAQGAASAVIADPTDAEAAADFRAALAIYTHVVEAFRVPVFEDELTVLTRAGEAISTEGVTSDGYGDDWDDPAAWRASLTSEIADFITRLNSNR